MVHLGQTADIRLNAYPDRVIQGTIGEIDAVLDPSIRTAKVRIQVNNPDRLMRLGMFATATFHGRRLAGPRGGAGLGHPPPARP